MEGPEINSSSVLLLWPGPCVSQSVHALTGFYMTVAGLFHLDTGYLARTQLNIQQTLNILFIRCDRLRIEHVFVGDPLGAARQIVRPNR